MNIISLPTTYSKIILSPTTLWSETKESWEWIRPHCQIYLHVFENVLWKFTVLYNDSSDAKIKYVKRRDTAKKGLFTELGISRNYVEMVSWMLDSTSRIVA